jgi:signal transduction histidine kinase
MALVCGYAVLSGRAEERQTLREEARTVLSLFVHNSGIARTIADRSGRVDAWTRRAEEFSRSTSRVAYVTLHDSRGRDLTIGRLSAQPLPSGRPEEDVIQPGILAFFEPPTAHVSMPLPGMRDAYARIGLTSRPSPSGLTIPHLARVAAVLAFAILVNALLVRLCLHRLVRRPAESPRRALYPPWTTPAERRLHRHMARQDEVATMGVLVAGVAHEINNALDGLQNCVRRIIRDPANTTQIERYAGLMTAALDHIEAVVKQLLRLSQKPERVVRPVLINEVLTDTLALARAGRRWKNVEVDWRLGGDIPPVLADPQSMIQVFLNLVLNAVDAMQDGGRLIVATSARSGGDSHPEDAEVLIEITDTGGGIAPETAAHIFEPFYTTKRNNGGTGLGLAVAHDLVVEHAGRIEFQSTPNVGTTFCVVLPTFSSCCQIQSRRVQPGEARACA